jgi:hypothetical protein
MKLPTVKGILTLLIEVRCHLSAAQNKLDRGLVGPLGFKEKFLFK